MLFLVLVYAQGNNTNLSCPLIFLETHEIFQSFHCLQTELAPRSPKSKKSDLIAVSAYLTGGLLAGLAKISECSCSLADISSAMDIVFNTRYSLKGVCDLDSGSCGFLELVSIPYAINLGFHYFAFCTSLQIH